jgi:hypothetical protein
MSQPHLRQTIFRKSDGLLLGAQALGEDGVVSRVNTLAALIQMHATVYDLEEASFVTHRNLAVQRTR